MTVSVRFGPDARGRETGDDGASPPFLPSS